MPVCSERDQYVSVTTSMREQKQSVRVRIRVVLYASLLTPVNALSYMGWRAMTALVSHLRLSD